MTLLLASVTDVTEAHTALAHGADIIDLKDATKSAFAALPVATIRAVMAAVGGRCPVSSVVDDRLPGPEAVVEAVGSLAQCGVDYIKVGLHPGARSQDIIRALAPAARGADLIGVMFADRARDDALVAQMAGCGFSGAMLDTADKGSGRLLDHMDITEVNAFVARCHALGLMAGLAGSLEPPDIPRLLLVSPDVLGFRGALCGGRARAGRLDATAVQAVRELIPLETSGPVPEPTPGVDYRLLAARGYSADTRRTVDTDRIFVHDFVMPVHIGAYAHEHGHAQDVRFSIDVLVARGDMPAGLRDVFSYDLILDGIRLIVSRGHIPLVETLAERIADFLLVHPRVVSATVRIDKLDLGPGTVGVEIRRDRPPEIAKVHHLYPAAVRGWRAAE